MTIVGVDRDMGVELDMFRRPAWKSYVFEECQRIRQDFQLANLKYSVLLNRYLQYCRGARQDTCLNVCNLGIISSEYQASHWPDIWALLPRHPCKGFFSSIANFQVLQLS